MDDQTIHRLRPAEPDPVADVLAAVDFYRTRLGFGLGFTWGDPVTFAGVTLGSVQLFLQQGVPGGGCSVYFAVGDADELLEYHRANGVEIVEPVADRDYGMRDYGVLDYDCHASYRFVEK